MTYNITKYSFAKAKELGVTIKPASNPLKKIDVFDRDGKKIASIGSSKNYDYHKYRIEKGIDYAMKRRELYIKRHKKDIENKKGNGYWAFELLWN
jgi:hypothetical protein